MLLFGVSLVEVQKQQRTVIAKTSDSQINTLLALRFIERRDNASIIVGGSLTKCKHSTVVQLDDTLPLYNNAKPNL